MGGVEAPLVLQCVPGRVPRDVVGYSPSATLKYHCPSQFDATVP
jgi:hypothetical protein